MEFSNSYLAGPTVKNSKKHKNTRTCDFNYRIKTETITFLQKTIPSFSAV